MVVYRMYARKLGDKITKRSTSQQKIEKLTFLVCDNRARLLKIDIQLKILLL